MGDNMPKVGVGVIVIKIIDGKPHLMMHQRKKDHGNGNWGSGGGHLELGEPLMEGALRELQEEAGTQLKVRNVRHLGVYNFTEQQPEHYVDISFVADWESGEPQTTEPEKSTDWQWFDLDDLPSPLFPPVRIYLEAYKTGKSFFDSKFE